MLFRSVGQVASARAAARPVSPPQPPARAGLPGARPVATPPVAAHPLQPPAVAQPGAAAYPVSGVPGANRPVSPAVGSRGAAAVPAPVPRQHPVAGYPQPRPLARPPYPESSGTSAMVVVLAVVLGMLVLICSGVIGYQWRKHSGDREQNYGLATTAMVTARYQSSDGQDAGRAAPYRQMQPSAPAGGVTR